MENLLNDISNSTSNSSTNGEDETMIGNYSNNLEENTNNDDGNIEPIIIDAEGTDEVESTSAEPFVQEKQQQQQKERQEQEQEQQDRNVNMSDNDTEEQNPGTRTTAQPQPMYDEENNNNQGLKRTYYQSQNQTPNQYQQHDQQYQQQPYIRRRSSDYDNNNNNSYRNYSGRGQGGRYNNYNNNYNNNMNTGGYRGGRGAGGYENNNQQGFYNNNNNYNNNPRYNNNNMNDYRYNNQNQNYHQPMGMGGTPNRFFSNYNNSNYDRRSNPRGYNNNMRGNSIEYPTQRQYNNSNNSNVSGNNDNPPTQLSTLEPMDSYKAFIMKQEENLSPDLYQSKYEEYTKNYRLRALQAFFDDHKKEEWLQERYSPVMRSAYQKKMNELKKSDMEDLYAKLKSQQVRVCLDEKSCFKTVKPIENVAEVGEEITSANEEIPIPVDNDQIPNDHILYIRRIPCECPVSFFESSIKAALSASENTEETQDLSFPALYLSDPCRKASFDFDRSGWLVFDSAEKAHAAMDKLSNLTVHEDGVTGVPFRLQVMQNRPRGSIKLSSSMAVPERIEHDFAQAKKLAEILDRPLFEEHKLLQKNGNENDLNQDDNTNDQQDASETYGINRILEDPAINEIYTTTRMKLDAVIAYLRRVHYVIYYAGVVCRDKGDIMHTHPALFMRADEPTEKDVIDFNERKAKVDQETEEGENETESNSNSLWNLYGTNLDHKIADIMKDYDWDKLRKEAQKLKETVEDITEKEEEELVLIYNEYVVRASDDSEKHRCGLCKKLFKAAEFVQKHIRNKHPELVEEKISKILEGYMVEEYKNDENRPMAVSNNQGVRLGHSGYQGRFPRRGGRYDHSSGDYRHQSNYHSGDGYGGRGGGYSGGRGGYHHTRHHDNYYRPYNQGQRQSQVQGRLPALLGSLPVDPRAVSTSYQDLDNIQDSAKVDVNFATGLNNLPPPKKRQRTENKETEATETIEATESEETKETTETTEAENE